MGIDISCTFFFVILSIKSPFGKYLTTLPETRYRHGIMQIKLSQHVNWESSAMARADRTGEWNMSISKADTPSSIRKYSISSRYLSNVTRTNPESYLNTAQGSSQEPGLDGSGAQLDRNYGLLWYEDRKLSEGPWFPGIAQIREAERAAGDKLEFRSNTRNTAQR